MEQLHQLPMLNSSRLAPSNICGANQRGSERREWVACEEEMPHHLTQQQMSRTELQNRDPEGGNRTPIELFLTGFADWPAATSKLLELEHLSHY